MLIETKMLPTVEMAASPASGRGRTNLDTRPSVLR